MNSYSLSQDIVCIRDIGPTKAEVLKKELQIENIAQLLEHYPFRYVDRTIFTPIRNIKVDDKGYVQIKAKIIAINVINSGRKKRLSVIVEDNTGELELLWFVNYNWIQKQLYPKQEYIIFGRPNIFNKKINMAHPEIQIATNQSLSTSIEPIYRTTEKLSKKALHSRGLQKIFKELLITNGTDIEETLPKYIVDRYNFLSKGQTIKNIHFPVNFKMLEAARIRLKFEELFYLQLSMLFRKKQVAIKSKGHVFKSTGDNTIKFYKEELSFELTKAQKRVVKEIYKDLKSGRQMNRLLQGDVGSGKTIVAFITMLIAIDNNYQCCLIAPTEILASQHYQTLKQALGNIPVRISILTGSVKQKDRKPIFENLKNGTINIIIATHALLEDTVQFKNLGLAVIDEQHKFGVKQRAKLWHKNKLPPHILLMTATPIPRTLAMTLYGDLNTSIIDELPPGRKPVKTIYLTYQQQLQSFQYVKKALKKNQQAYFIFPLIHESKKLDYKYLMDGFEYISKRFPKPQVQISCLHGDMAPENKEYEMQRFLKNETQIMIATTVVEVGVNIPNATVMVIENAEKFGLAQLHQLRGRIGRGGEESHCILVTGNALSQEARERMRIMTETTDGFKIAEADLKLRGPGNIQGLKQSGIIDFKIADIATDKIILEKSRNLAKLILKKDPDLVSSHNTILFIMLNKLKTNSWGRIS